MTVALEVPLLVLEGATFAYPLPGGGRRAVLRGVDLVVRSREIVALLGPNASGKTTLLRLAAGTLRPERGSARLAGRPLAEWRRDAVARCVAVLPQSLELPAGFRVSDLVDMGRAPHARGLFGPRAADERAVERALVDADALELGERLADELSGGERQRVLVAMALAQEPQLLLLDEPTVHLDLAHQVALLATIRRLREQRGIAVLAVLHDLNLASAFADRVVVLDGGVVGADGPPHEVLRTELLRRVFGVDAQAVETPRGRRLLIGP